MGILGAISTAVNFLNTFNIFNYAGSIGSYGPLTFQVSERKQLTPRDFSITYKGRSTKHQRLGTVDITEFQTRELRTATVPIKLIGTRTSIPGFMNTVQRIAENGEHYSLIIGGRSFGTYSLTSVGIKYVYTATNGHPAIAEADLNLEEYVPAINRVGAEISGILGTVAAVGTAIAEKNVGAIASLAGGRLW
ncbi:MAG: phage tail protein [Fusobacteriaceae bacterium]|jgi:phage protein U|nr:phage tail protein [Fusobacteriaceae bacterium]